MSRKEKYKVIEDFYRANYKGLLKQVRGPTGTPHNAEDVVQEAFTRALEYCSAWDPTYPFENWFSRILQNSLRTFNADRRAHGMVTADDVFDPPLNQDAYLVSLLGEIKKDLQAIPEERKEIIELSFFQGLDAKDISRIVNKSPGMIRTTLSRYREEVRDRYGEGLYR